MTERDLWNRVLRPVINKPPDHPEWVAYKVQDAFVKGLPDVVARLGNRVLWIELKILDHAPVRASTPWRIPVTMEQRRWLNAWNRAGPSPPWPEIPPAFVFVWLNREKKWMVIDPKVPEEVDQTHFNQYVLEEGTKETLAELFES